MSPTLAALRDILIVPPFPTHSAPPPGVESAYDAFLVSTYRSITPAVWAEMERSTYRGPSCAEMARAWAVHARKALHASVHGGNEDAAVLQIVSASSCARL